MSPVNLDITKGSVSGAQCLPIWAWQRNCADQHIRAWRCLMAAAGRARRFLGLPCDEGTDRSIMPLLLWDAGLNSTPELSLMFLLVICLQALKVSYEHSVNARDKKGMVSRMGGISVSLGGRSAASLAAAYSTFVGCVELSGGSG